MTAATKAIADRIRVTGGDASASADADQLVPRTTLIGELLPAEPVHPLAWHSGNLDREHSGNQKIRAGPATRSPRRGGRRQSVPGVPRPAVAPDQLEKLAVQLAMQVNPDGKFSDEDHARKPPGSIWSPTSTDGMKVPEVGRDA